MGHRLSTEKSRPNPNSNKKPKDTTSETSDHNDKANPTPDPTNLPAVNITPPENGKLYSDWSETYSFTPNKVLSPQSPQELSKMLKDNENAKISVVASAHSCSGNWSSNTVITLDNMPYVLEDLSANKDHSRVRVSAQMSFREILVKLAMYGRTLPATGGVDEQQLGGLLGTNTAPATKERRIYDGIVKIEYTTKDSAVNVVEGDDLKAFICNLGITGVITSITWDTIPDEGFRVIQRIKPVDELIQLMVEGKNFINDEPDDNTEEYTFWRFDWVPESDFALLWAARVINTVEDPNYEAYGDYVAKYKMPFDMHIYDWVAKISTEDPFCNKALLTVFDTMKIDYEAQPKKNTFYGPLRNMLPVDRFANENVYCAMAEWSFLPTQIADVVQLYKEYFNRTKWPNLPIEIEYVKCDDYYMSPWNSSQMTAGGEGVPFLVKINLMWYSLGHHKRDPNFRKMIEDHAKGIWDILKANKINFKAHWGKINFTTPDDVQRLFDWSEFKPYIHSQFCNDYITERLPSLY